jgi:hypothetical protein
MCRTLNSDYFDFIEAVILNSPPCHFHFMRDKSVATLLSGIILLSLCALSCSHKGSPAAATGAKNNSVSVSSPSCIIYRTRSDYSVNVPVTLSDDKTRIVSYPDIKDIYYNGRLSVPTLLSEGFFLDNRGIGAGVAFLSYTYDEYSKLASTPPAAELMKKIIDKDPLVEMYDCGKRSQYSNPEEELNAMIRAGDFKRCTKIK